MSRREAEALLAAAGFTEHRGSKHVQWRNGEIWVGLSHGRSRLTTDEEAALRRKLKRALRYQARHP